MQFDLQQITAILENTTEYQEGHHLGRPFMSAYQIAIEFSQRHPEEVERHGLQIGGAGVGVHESLAQQIARFLSIAIHRGEAPRIEGGFISHANVVEFAFSAPDCSTRIRVSTLTSASGHAIFRISGAGTA